MTTPQKPPLIGAREAVFFSGLLVAGGGGALLSLPWTLVVLGAVLAIKANGPLVIVRREAK